VVIKQQSSARCRPVVLLNFWPHQSLWPQARYHEAKGKWEKSKTSRTNAIRVYPAKAVDRKSSRIQSELRTIASKTPNRSNCLPPMENTHDLSWGSPSWFHNSPFRILKFVLCNLNKLVQLITYPNRRPKCIADSSTYSPARPSSKAKMEVNRTEDKY